MPDYLAVKYEESHFDEPLMEVEEKAVAWCGARMVGYR
jgi:hypothetical protein